MKNKTIKAVIIDDLDSAQDSLIKDLEDHCPQVEVVGTAKGVISAAKLLKKVNPDVLFLDIELEDGTGFDLLEILPSIDYKIIFTTASDQHAIRAFRFSAIDYLLKPIDVDSLCEAVGKVKEIDSKEKVDVLMDHWSMRDNEQRITLQDSDQMLIVKLKEIIRCEAENNYTTFYLMSGDRFLVSKTLKSYERLLEGLGFVRVHQSHLVNTAHIKAYIKTEGGYLQVSSGDRVPVSLRKKALVTEIIARLGDMDRGDNLTH